MGDHATLEDLLAVLPALVEAQRAAALHPAARSALDGTADWLRTLSETRALAAGAAAGLADGPRGALAAALRAQGDADASAPQARGHDTALGAVAALFQAHGRSLSEAQAREMAALDAGAPSVSAALARIADAHLLQVEGARRAHEQTPYDRALLLATREAVALRALDAARDLQPVAVALPSFAACANDLLDLDLAGVPSQHACDAALVVDVGGDDAYMNNAGGASLLGGGLEAALLLDLSGDDAYVGTARGEAGLVGGAFGGSGILLDLEGDDTYAATADSGAGLNGGGYLGVGLLFDGDGNDAYLATIRAGNGAVNGGGSLGAGLLVDAAAGPAEGRDRYEGTVALDGAANGGSLAGLGLLADQAGPDTYLGTVGGLGGANGGAHEGAALLVDAAGDDWYEGRVARGGIQGGAAYGTAALRDGGGADVYAAILEVRGAANGGALLGAGVLEDAGGEGDLYLSYLLGAGGAAGRNGGAIGGAAVLADGGGHNMFLAYGGGPLSASHGAGLGAGPVPGGPAPAVGGVGVLLAGEGDDRYLTGALGAGAMAGGATQGAGDRYGLGLLVDRGGTNDYTAFGQLAQGAGAHGGLGVLVDAGRGSAMTLQAGSSGQGAGIGGVGIVVRTSPEGSPIYGADAASASFVARGAGAGLRVDHARPLGPMPPITCGSAASEIAAYDQEFGNVAFGELRLCYPDPATGVCVLDPASGTCVPGLRAEGGLVLHAAPSAFGTLGDALGVRARITLAGSAACAVAGCPPDVPLPGLPDVPLTQTLQGG